MSDGIQAIRQLLTAPLAAELEAARPPIPPHLRRQFVELVEEHFGQDLRNKRVRAQFAGIAKAVGAHWSGEGTDNG